MNQENYLVPENDPRVVRINQQISYLRSVGLGPGEMIREGYEERLRDLHLERRRAIGLARDLQQQTVAMTQTTPIAEEELRLAQIRADLVQDSLGLLNSRRQVQVDTYGTDNTENPYWTAP